MGRLRDKFWKGVAIMAIVSSVVLTAMGLTGTVFQLRMLF